MDSECIDDRTIAAFRAHHWVGVLLRPRSKRPVGDHWVTTSDPGVIAEHVERGGNIGLLCGAESGVAVLDFDDLDAAREMIEALGPLPLSVRPGSGKWHSYVRWEDGLPAKILWQGRTVGEVQRGPRQQIVIPPSVHPVTGRPYAWLGDPRAAPPALPPEWRHHLSFGSIPAWIEVGAIGHPEEEPWDGPPPDEVIHRALQQPGARRRRGGVKFRCPACRAEGHDRHRDNAIVFADGRWGCAFAPHDAAHRRAIGDVLIPTFTTPAANPEPMTPEMFREADDREAR